MLTCGGWFWPVCRPWPRGCSPAMSHAFSSVSRIPQAGQVCWMEALRLPYAQPTLREETPRQAFSATTKWERPKTRRGVCSRK